MIAVQFQCHLECPHVLEKIQDEKHKYAIKREAIGY